MMTRALTLISALLITVACGPAGSAPSTAVKPAAAPVVGAPAAGSPVAGSPAAGSPAAIKPKATAAPSATALAYSANRARSKLEFSGMQAGAAFKGEFKQYTAKVQFDPAAPATGRIDVNIDMNSVDSQDSERDGNIRGADFFDVAKNPTATYATRSISKTPNGYTATGILTLRGVSREVPLEFQFNKTATGATLSGSAKLKRLDFGVGQGEWKSTEWVGNDVSVDFSLDLNSAP